MYIYDYKYANAIHTKGIITQLHAIYQPVNYYMFISNNMYYEGNCITLTPGKFYMKSNEKFFNSF